MRDFRVVTRKHTPPATDSLGVIVGLFQRLHKEGIPYCNWKSNEHLAQSMTGLADLDVLVDRRFVLPLAQVLADLGFKRLLAGPGRAYAGIEDYIGFDTATGRLTHLHLHYQLTLGEKHLKGYRLPWESAVLATATVDAQFGVYVADPNVEMLLLLVRSAMKIRTRDLLADRFGRRLMKGSTLTEFRWLAERVDEGILGRVATNLVGEAAERVVHEIVADGRPSLRQLRELRRLADPSWDEYRMYSAGAATVRRWLREARSIAKLARRRVSPRSARLAVNASGRVSPSGGLIAALVGADGSGKSTVAAEVTRWLSREVATVTMYGGSGSGPASLLRLLVERSARLVRRRSRGSHGHHTAGTHGTNGGRPKAPAHPSGTRAIGFALWALLLAAERRRNMRRARRARDGGKVVIADRFPQSQFNGLNDGPKLAAWSATRMPLLRLAASIERSAYESIERTPPDLVVKLQVAPEIALRRKPDTPADRLRQKARVVSLLRYPPATRVIEVDASQPLDQVILQVKRAVWESL